MKVRFLPDGQEIEIKAGETLLQAARRNEIEIKSICKGIPSCAECRVYIAEGENNVSPPSNAELNLIGTAYFVDRRRLACQLRPFGDIVIDLTEQKEKLTRSKQGKTESQAVTGNIMMEPQNREDLNERMVQKIIETQEKELALKKIKTERQPHPQNNFYKNFLSKDEKKPLTPKTQNHSSNFNRDGDRDKDGGKERGGNGERDKIRNHNSNQRNHKPNKNDRNNR